MKKGNIVGEPFAKYVNEQIKQRQSFHGSGFKTTRDPKHIQYLNSKTSWVKMASSVSVKDENEQIDTPVEGKTRLKNIGLETLNDFLGQGLARKAVLFNGLSEAKFKNIEGTKENPVNKNKTEQFSGFNQRAGYSKSNSIWNSEFAYGLGGTDFGIQPMPGITGVEISHLNRGSIRKATVTLKAYNKFQFDLIETLYLRLGYTMLLEWGNSHYIENDTVKDNEGNVISRSGDLQQVGNTLVEDFWFVDNYPSNQTHLGVLKKVEEYRKRYDGNYDGFFGRVSNFNWGFNQDASYDITIDLISLGDIIESLKINTLSSPTTTPLDETASSKENQSTILNYFKNRRENFKEIKVNPDNKDFYSAENSLSKRKLYDRWFKDSGDEKYYYYIRFGKFLEILNKNIISSLKNSNGGKFPLINIDNDVDANVMSIYPNQFSLNPKVCIIRSGYFTPPLKNAPGFFFDLEKFYDFTFNPPHGKIMNIYLNFDLVERTIKANTDSSGNLSLFTLLQTICKEINKSLGSINKLEPIIDEDRNTVLIIDQNALPQKGRNKLRKNILSKEDPKIEEEQESVPFELYGYNRENSTSNFVKSFSFKTEIGPDLSTIISIGATAQGTVVGEDATAFSKWNSGLKDRFQQEIIEPDKIEKLTNTNKDQNSLKNNSILGDGTRPASAILGVGQKQDLSQFSEFQKYIMRAWGGRTYSGEYEGNRKYFISDDNFINQGLKLFTHDYFENTKKRAKATSSIGFIPVKLSLEVDGISGIKIYQSLKINTNFLPENYPEVLEFLVTKVNHTLQNNQWVTKIETISQPVVEEIKVDINYKPILLGDTQERIAINDLRPSDNAYNILKREEGFRRFAYDDKNPGKIDKPLPLIYTPQGKLTIGYGQTTIRPNISTNPLNNVFTSLERDVEIGDTITQDQSFEWVKNTKIPRDIERIKRWLKVPLTQNEFDALILFTYNTGPGSGNKETFVKLLNNKQYIEAGNYLINYKRDKSGDVLPGLIKRRKIEINLWMTDNPGDL